MTKVDFMLDKVGGADILRNNEKIISMQDELSSKALASIEAQFFLDFNVEGKFEVDKAVGVRSRVMIRAADKKTGAILRNNPGWMTQFIDNMVI